MSRSTKTNLIELLASVNKFVVPTIQRDYAQGRNKGSDKDLCEEVRTGLIDSLYNALIDVGGEELVLDYIYGTTTAGIFFPIDGQQRLTTLFLLHWYIGKKENLTEDTEFNALRKFSYEIRDTSKEFCTSLFDIDIDFNKPTVSSQIIDSPQYHNTYNYDPTVSSMLVVLDLIHERFKGVQEQLWPRLRKIQFWSLYLEQFGLTDDLFVKMNARGKRLSRFDVFKSDFESRIEKTSHNRPELNAAIEKWKKEIDNTYLDCFWERFGVELSERNLFRTILFFMKSVISTQKISDNHDDSWEEDESNAYYYDILEEVENEPESLSKICNVLSNFRTWEPYVKGSRLFIENSGVEKTEAITGYNKAIVFGVLYWFSYSEDMKDDLAFGSFYRILKNYVFSLRQFNIKPRNYSSSIDNKNVERCFEFIKRLIDGFPREMEFNDYVRNSVFSELSYEIDKLKHSELPRIIDIEKIQYIKGNTHNLYFNGNLYLDAPQIKTIFTDADLTNKAIRIIYSYAPDEYGKFRKLLLDEITQQSGKKQLYYNGEDDKATAYFHKIIFNSSADFGDNILTAKGSVDSTYDELSKCVQAFVLNLSHETKSGKTVQNSIDDLLTSRLSSCTFDDPQNIKWYIVKYPEFFYEKNATSLSVLRRKNYGGIDDENIYDIQCVSSSDNNFCQIHYHPFYLALRNLLDSRVAIDESELKYTDVHIEYAHPCVLSNGWRIRINKDGNWDIVFGKNCPTSAIPDLVINKSGDGVYICDGVDSIAKMANFINSL